jgi:hypothetical protein
MPRRIHGRPIAVYGSEEPEKKVKSKKQKLADLQAKRKERRAKKDTARREEIKRQGRIVRGVVIPEDAVPADTSQQAPNSSYDLVLSTGMWNSSRSLI